MKDYGLTMDSSETHGWYHEDPRNYRWYNSFSNSLTTTSTTHSTSQGNRTDTLGTTYNTIHGSEKIKPTR